MKKPSKNNFHLNIFSFISIIMAIFVNSTYSIDQFMYLKNDCSKDENKALENQYQNNLDLLLANLASKAETNTFYNSTNGENPNKVYGLFLCNNLFIDQVCHECITRAASEIGQRCTSSLNGTFWYSSCMLRYANVDIFSVNDVSVYYNILVGPTKYKPYGQRLTDSFISLINMATKVNSSSTSAIISVYVTGDVSMGCYVDCTPDIGLSECSHCLQTALGRLGFDGSQSGMVLQPSCRLSYIFSDATSFSQGKVYYAAVYTILGIALASVVMNVYICLERKKIDAYPFGLDELDSMEHLRFNYAGIKEATGDFSEVNKLGQGGFGVVYLGTFPDGKTIGVKRLSNESNQGIKEFKTEACLTARLQHRNLVKLFGFSLEKQEMLLVYEYMPNKSLDRLLFDPKRRENLKWKTRYKIIIGLARGLSYLHEDCQPQIIHRDLKPSNILLDEDMNPRVADFGIAKSFGFDQTQDDTTNVTGTRGYMAPEYITTGRCSTKTDIFSFGVILLEIVSGQRNHPSFSDDHTENLLSYAWGLWKDGQHLKLVDLAMQNDFTQGEVEKCIHIGLLCIQKDPAKRPGISSVLLNMIAS